MFIFIVYTVTDAHLHPASAPKIHWDNKNLNKIVIWHTLPYIPKITGKANIKFKILGLIHCLNMGLLWWSQFINSQSCEFGFCSYYNCKITFSSNHQETLKSHRFITYKTRNCTAPLGLHSQVMGRKREE